MPEEYWRVLDNEAFLALMPADKFLAHAVRLMQHDAAQARRGLRREYVNYRGEIQRDNALPSGVLVTQSQQLRESSMRKYEVRNIKSSHSFGVYEADSAEAAVAACCKDAGYDSKVDAEVVMGHESELVAVEVK